MRGVDATLEALQPVALLDDLRDVPMRRRRLGPRELRQRRPPVLGAQVGPDHAAHLHGGIGRGADLVGEAELLGLVHHVHAPAVDVELPAVVHAAQAAVLVAAEEEGHPPVRAVLLEQADLAPAVAEGHQLLAQELDAHRWAIGFRQLPRQERRHPVPAHRVAHGGAGADAGRSLVVVVCQHDLASSGPARIQGGNAGRAAMDS